MDHLTSDSVTPESHAAKPGLVALTGYVYLQDFGGSEPGYVLFNNNRMGDRNYTLIGPVNINYEVPASFNPTAAQIAALEEEKAKLRANFLARVREIETRIGNLQALEMTVEA